MTTTILHGGTIVTMDPEQPAAEAIAIAGGRIRAVGSNHDILSLSGPGVQLIDLRGATVTPGFNDAHVHVWKIGHLKTTMLDLRGCESLAELKQRIRDFDERLPDGAWLMARGWNEADLAEGRGPARKELDELLPHRPVWLIRTCAHIAVANSAALRAAGIDRNTQDVPGGVIERDESGEPTGIFHESALGLVANCIPKPTQRDYEKMILAGAEHLRASGVTSATDPAVHPELREAYFALASRAELPLRMNLLSIRRPDGGTETLEAPEAYRDEWLRMDSIKLFADGGLSGATAALSLPYRHSDTTGVLRLDEEELFELAREPVSRGLRICTHAIGDCAIEAVISAYERLRQVAPHTRHRIEHLGLPEPEHLERMAQARMMAVPQAIFLSALGANFRRCLDDTFLDRAYPVRSMLDAGLTVALSSDGPVVGDTRPLAGMRDAITRNDAMGKAIAPHESITAEQALGAYTVGGAVASGEATHRGALKAGMAADLVVLPQNPLQTPPEELPEMEPSLVMIAGRVMHGDPGQIYSPATR